LIIFIAEKALSTDVVANGRSNPNLMGQKTNGKVISLSCLTFPNYDNL